MASGATGSVVRHLGRLFASGAVAGLSEGQLLDRFVSRQDEAAFEAIVSRHGPMVLGVCRRLLRDPNDVDDAFQATFHVLVRKAASLRRRDRVGNWLYGVAYRVSVRSRATAARRAATETPDVESVAAAPEPAAPWPELYEEVERLPERYRAAVVLCYLEGLTHEEAADRLGWPVGTVKGRLSRARDLLRSRLTRRGLTLASASAVADRLALEAPAAVPATLFDPLTRAAALVASGRLTAAGLISTRAGLLSEGVIHAMTLSKLKTAALSVTLAGSVLAGAGVLAYQENAGDNPPGPAARKTPAGPSGGAHDAAPIRETKRVNPPAAVSGIPVGVDPAEPMRLRRIDLLKVTRDEHMRAVEEKRRLVQSLQESQAEASSKLEYARHDLQRAQAVLDQIETSLIAARTGEALVTTASDRPLEEPRPTMPGAPKPSAPAILPPATVPPGMPVQAIPDPGFVPEVGGVKGGGLLGGMDGGRIAAMGGLPTAQSPAAVKNRMRVLNAILLKQVARDDEEPATRAILKKLDVPIPMSFVEPTPLDDVLNYIKSTTTGPEDQGIPIYVDPEAMNALMKGRFDPDKVTEEDRKTYTSVRIDLEGVPLKTSLRLLLKQLDLAYCVKDGVLIISSVQGIYMELLETVNAQAEADDKE